MSTQPRFDSAVPGEAANFATVMSHAPAVLTTFFALYGRFWQHGAVAQEIKEMTRLRNARITDCGY